MTCNPGRNVQLGSLHVNTFAGTTFDQLLPTAHADIDPNMDKVTPVLEFVRTVHADDDQPTFDYIMNWLTKMVGRREKMKTALLFFGPKGAGKDIIFERLISRMYGAYYVHKTAKGVDTSFNGEFAGKLFVLWCEIEVTMGNVQQLKDMVRSPDYVEHKKGKDIKARSCWRVCETTMPCNICDASFVRTRSTTTDRLPSRRMALDGIPAWKIQKRIAA